MTALLRVIRALLIFFGFITVLIIAAVAVVIGGLYMLLTGRRPQVRVFKPQGFGSTFGQQDAFFRRDDFGRPPMKDVTPQTSGTLPGQS